MTYKYNITHSFDRDTKRENDVSLFWFAVVNKMFKMTS